VTFEEAHRHPGVETQRQWSEPAIRRTMPALLGLCSVVALTAHHLTAGKPGWVPRAEWYRKTVPTFADALDLVRRTLWAPQACCTSAAEPDTVKVPRAVMDRLTRLLCYAA
jgi:hypothetical protein